MSVCFCFAFGFVLFILNIGMYMGGEYGTAWQLVFDANAVAVAVELE